VSGARRKTRGMIKMMSKGDKEMVRAGTRGRNGGKMIGNEADGVCRPSRMRRGIWRQERRQRDGPGKGGRKEIGKGERKERRKAIKKRKRAKGRRFDVNGNEWTKDAGSASVLMKINFSSFIQFRTRASTPSWLGLFHRPTCLRACLTV